MWLEYFVGVLAQVFVQAREEALRLAEPPPPIEPEAIQRLDSRARRVLALFATADRITAAQVAQTLGRSPRMARNLLQGWVADGWLEVADLSRLKRAHALSAAYRQYIGSLSAMPPK